VSNIRNRSRRWIQTPVDIPSASFVYFKCNLLLFCVTVFLLGWNMETHVDPSSTAARNFPFDWLSCSHREMYSVRTKSSTHRLTYEKGKDSDLFLPLTMCDRIGRTTKFNSEKSVLIKSDIYHTKTRCQCVTVVRDSTAILHWSTTTAC